MSTSIHRLVTPLLLGVLLLAACGGPAATAPSAAPDEVAVSEPASTEAAASEAAASEPAASEAAAADASAAASPTPEPLIAGPLKEVPREQTVVLGHGLDTLGVTNPWAVPGYTHQERQRFMWEPLAYYRHLRRRRNPLAGREHGATTTTSPRSRSRCAAAPSGATARPSRPRTWSTPSKGQLNNDKLPVPRASSCSSSRRSSRPTT